MADLSQYLQNRHLCRTGDLVASWGTEPVSGIIELLEHGGPSHVMVVSQEMHAHGPHDPEIWECTIKGKRNGAQRNPLGSCLEGAKAVTLFPLAESVRRRSDWKAFYAAIGKWTDEIHYDIGGLFREFLPTISTKDPRANEMFCSAGACRLYGETGIIPKGLNWSTMTPLELCRLRLYSTEIPLVGQRGIEGFVPCT